MGSSVSLLAHLMMDTTRWIGPQHRQFIVVNGNAKHLKNNNNNDKEKKLWFSYGVSPCFSQNEGTFSSGSNSCEHIIFHFVSHAGAINFLSLSLHETAFHYIRSFFGWYCWIRTEKEQCEEFLLFCRISALASCRRLLFCCKIWCWYCWYDV